MPLPHLTQWSQTMSMIEDAIREAFDFAAGYGWGVEQVRCDARAAGLVWSGYASDLTEEELLKRCGFSPAGHVVVGPVYVEVRRDGDEETRTLEVSMCFWRRHIPLKAVHGARLEGWHVSATVKHAMQSACGEGQMPALDESMGWALCAAVTGFFAAMRLHEGTQA